MNQGKMNWSKNVHGSKKSINKSTTLLRHQACIEIYVLAFVNMKIGENFGEILSELFGIVTLYCVL